MTTRKIRHILVNVEPIICELIDALRAKTNSSASGNVRAIIIKHLIDSSVLTKSMLAGLAGDDR